MKIQVLVAAVALACGGAAIAQQSTSSSPSYGTASTSAPSDARSDSGTKMSGGESIGEKAKRGAHRVGSAIRRAGHKLANAGHRGTHHDQQASANDTRSMGASGDDSGRRARMDSAYSNWQKKQRK